MKISVVIPARNAADTIGLQLDALSCQRLSDPWEVIVADNGSTDDTVSIARSYATKMPHLRVVDASATRGAAHAMNRGAAVARGEFVVFCDADDEVASGWLTAMDKALSSHDVVASRMEFDKLNSPWVAASYRNHPQTHRLPRLWYPPYLPNAGACGLGVRRSLHQAVNGFDESLFQVMDADYCLRLQRIGASLSFAADAVVHIRCRATPTGAFKQLRVWGEYNVLVYKRYRPSLDYDWTRWKTHAKDWARLLRALPEWRTPKGRSDWFRRLGWQAGILKGSLKYGVPPIPLP